MLLIGPRPGSGATASSGSHLAKSRHRPLPPTLPPSIFPQCIYRCVCVCVSITAASSINFVCRRGVRKCMRNSFNSRSCSCSLALTLPLGPAPAPPAPPCSLLYCRVAVATVTLLPTLQNGLRLLHYTKRNL